MAVKPLLSVVVPTRNEAENVIPLLSRLRRALDEQDFEVLFIDDSDDGTPAALASIASRDPRVDMIHREGPERAGGLSTAVVRGLHAARGEFVCVMDADLQHPPETIPAMLDAARAGVDVVVASRYVRGGSRIGLDGFGRRVVSRTAGTVARALFTEARASTDPLSGFFLCRRRVLDGIEFRPVGFKILMELLVCVPGLKVADVPLRFEARTAGASKAGLSQGRLFLIHLLSLFFDVQGSARRWKFALVGVSGLAILVPLIALLTGPFHLNALAAFAPAFVVSLVWNGVLNRLWTFADQRHGRGDSAVDYVRRGLLSGLVMFAAYAGLAGLGLVPAAAATAAATLAMTLNGAANRAAVHRRPRVWGEAAAADDIQEAMRRLAAELGADRCYALPARGATPAALPVGLLECVLTERRGLLFTEAASHRTQRRSNIAVTSTLLVPVVDGSEVRAVLVCERLAPRPFDNSQLEAAMGAAGHLARLFAGDGDSRGADVPVATPALATGA
jgi:dolichol-phosphate mannosyltransferase